MKTRNDTITNIVDNDPIATTNLRALAGAASQGNVPLYPVFGNVRAAIVRNAVRRAHMTVRMVHGQSVAVRQSANVR